MQYGLRGLASLVLLALLSACQSTQTEKPSDIPRVSAARAAEVDATLARLVEEHDVTTAGAAIIRNGDIEWTGYYGEQSPGVPASASTIFNVASISKTITAETILHLVDKGALSLDEPIHPWWVDPDIANDPRHKQLTPRLLLTHKSGFPNWRFFLDDRKLRFISEPGTTYGYSGEGFEYLARYAEEKLGRVFDALVREELFEPLGMQDAAFSIQPERFDDMAQALGDDGKFHGHYCRPNGWCRKPGSWSAADDFVVSVEDYARFLIATRNHVGYGEALADQRNRVATDKGDNESVDCSSSEVQECPQTQGYGLGWDIVNFGDNQLVSHGGTDWSEVALGYFYTRSGDGLVVFLNAPTVRGMAVMPEAIEVMDPGSPMVDLYRKRLAAARKD